MNYIGKQARKIKTELYNDNFQNYKRYNIPKAQLVIADIPYNLGINAYASSSQWYIDGDNKNGESNKAGSGTTLRAARELNRNSYGFEVFKKFYNEAQEKMLNFKSDESQLSLLEMKASC